MATNLITTLPKTQGNEIMKKITALLVLLLNCSSLWATIDVFNFSSPQQEKDYHSLTQSLRCPQCQNNNIADSNATIAVDMRHKVFELLQQGQSKQQVVDYMVARYGHFVTYEPPLTAATWILWVMPVVFLLSGLWFIFRRRVPQTEKRTGKMPHFSEAETQRLQDILHSTKENKK